MKNENEFNAILGKHLKRYWGRYFHTKNADKYRVGVPDFYIWGPCGHASVECKFIMREPLDDKTPWLKKHKFTPEQITFLTCVKKAGGVAKGLIGIGEKKKMCVVDLYYIKNGNVTGDVVGDYYDITPKGVEELLKDLFMLERTHGPST